MRKFSISVVLAAVCLMSIATLGFAAKVEVYAVMEENTSPMELRSQALAEGFAQAVAEETQTMLGGTLDAVRLEAVKQYFIDHAKPYVQGYNILSSENYEDGLLMRLDVRVNRRTLRDGLTRLGFFETVQSLQPASVAWPEDITEEDLLKLQSLISMSGLVQAEGVYPAFILEYGPEQTYQGTLSLQDKQWTSANKDLSVVWTNLWTRFFTQPKDNVVASKTQSLTISGWFTPDGVLEFDRVLKGWESAVQDTHLVEMDIQPTGVGATWDVHILNRKRLATLLNSFLPQRGLSFQLNRDSDE